MVLSFALEAVDHSLLTADVLKLDSLLLTTCLHILDTIATISYAINWCNKFISLPIKLLAVIFTCATTSWPQNCILSPPYQGPWWHVLPAVCHHFHSVTLNVCHQSWADDVSWVPLWLIPIFVEWAFPCPISIHCSFGPYDGNGDDIDVQDCRHLTTTRNVSVHYQTKSFFVVLQCQMLTCTTLNCTWS